MSKEKELKGKRSRSVAFVVRDGKILMEKLHFFERDFYSLPGGGIEDGESPEEAALRELKEECGLDGKIIRPLTKIFLDEEHFEFSFEVSVSDDQEAILGYDPEGPKDAQAIKEVLWMGLDEIPEKDRAFLCSYGLICVGDFFEEIKSWGDEISYPQKSAK